MAKTAKVPETFYWPKHGFYTKNQFDEWVSTDKETVRMKLIRAGFSSTGDNIKLSPASEAMLNIIEKKTVHYAGPIAGQAEGLTELCGFRVLVTSTPKIVWPAKVGKFPLWQEIIETHYGDFADYFLTWLKAAWCRVQKGGGPMLPALIIAGGPDTAKSLTQNHLITPLLGGRMAKPWRYWTGETNFNEDLCGAEHLMLEDEICPVKTEKRRMLGDALKASVANENTSLHPKGDKAITTKCVWAISISTNLEPQNLRVLPLHDASLNDKLLVLQVKRRPECLPAADDYQGFLKFTGKLRAELPALAAFLEKYQPPKEVRGQRSLVKPFRDAEIMEIVSEDDNVPKLIWLIDEVIFGAGGLNLSETFTSMELEKRLLAVDTNGQAIKLLSKVSIGYLLREAARRFPTRVEKDGASHNNLTRWIVKPEPKTETVTT
jgi:hypothetical protein